MKTTRTVKCPICNATVNAQGIGGHKMLAHGIIERVVFVDNTSQYKLKTSRHKLKESQHDLKTSSTLSADTSQHKLKTSQHNLKTSPHELTTHVSLPESLSEKDYVKMRREQYIFNNTHENCSHCGKLIKLYFGEDGYGNPNRKLDCYVDNIVCDDCIKGFYEECFSLGVGFAMSIGKYDRCGISLIDLHCNS